MSLSDVCYEFTAMACLPDSIALYVTVRGVPFDLTPQQTGVLWQDITECFVSAGFFRVSALLSGLSYDWNGAGTFVIKGPDTQREEIFHLLTHSFSEGREPDRPYSMSMEFYVSRNPPQVTIHAHHRAVYSWQVDQLKPSPVFQF